MPLSPTRHRPPQKADLVAELIEGAVPHRLLLGMEAECFGLVRPSLAPLGGGLGPSLETLLEGILESHGGEEIRDGGVLHGVRIGDATVTLEPGGQVEYSAPAAQTVADCAAVFGRYHDILGEIGAQRDLAWLWLGVHPFLSPAELPFVGKPRYRAMASYLPTRGAQALRMMQSTATVQVSLDRADPEDLERKFRALVRIAPVIYVLFANSPYRDGRANGALTNRASIWAETDPDRAGLPASFLAPDFGVDDYVEHSLDVPMFFIARDGDLVDLHGRVTFRRFMHEGWGPYRATLEDYRLHLSTLFYEVRMKRIIEVRSADCVPPEVQLALPALLAGLVYDPAAFGDLERMVRPWSAEDVLTALRELPVQGFAGCIGRHDAQGVIRDLLALAADGLGRREPGAVGYLEPLVERARLGRTFAEDLLARLGDDLRGHRPDVLLALLPFSRAA